MTAQARTIVTTTQQLKRALTAAGVEDKEAARLIQYFPLASHVRTWREHIAKEFDERFLHAPLMQIPMSVVMTGMWRELCQWRGQRDVAAEGAPAEPHPFLLPSHEMPPPEVQQAARVIARWFAERNVDRWELDGCASRSPTADTMLVIARQAGRPPRLTRVERDLVTVLRAWLDIDPSIELDVVTVRTRGVPSCSIENGRALLAQHQREFAETVDQAEAS